MNFPLNPKKMTSPFLAFLVLIFCISCSTISGDSVHLRSGYRIGVGAVSPKAKIFLIAGSSDSANFAQEVIDQIKFWKSQGYSKEQIACYYMPPLSAEKKDLKQFKELFADLRDCYFADPGAIFENIKSVAKSNPDEVYVYITSHGSRPIRETAYNNPTKKLNELKSMPLWSDSYYLSVQGYIGTDNIFWTYNDIDKALAFAPTNPKNVDRYLFTARGLRTALSALPEATKKLVILQGCHSGGFVLPEKSVGEGNTLDGLKNATVLTASRSDKTSFGCDAGSHTTYFGEAYMTALRKYADGKKLNEIDWSQIYNSTENQVSEQEAFVIKNKREYSRPQYYMN